MRGLAPQPQVSLPCGEAKAVLQPLLAVILLELGEIRQAGRQPMSVALRS